MSELKLLNFPDKKLTIAATPIDTVDNTTKQLAEDLITVLHEENLLGLSATHFGIAKQMVVIDLSAERNQAQVFINPKIIEQRGKAIAKEAGVAVPGVDVDIERATWIKFEALNQDGKPIEVEADDLFARVMQHEIDQMNGILFIDRVSKLKRERLIKQFYKQKQRGCGSHCGHDH